MPADDYNIIGSGDFIAPSVLSYPLVVASGASIDVIVRFAPSSYGARAGTITVVSSDPASPNVVHVSGTAPAPKANLIIANTGNFGNACVGSFVDEPLIVTNSDSCTLTVSAIVSSFAGLSRAGSLVVPDHHRARELAARAHSLPTRRPRF